MLLCSKKHATIFIYAGHKWSVIHVLNNKLHINDPIALAHAEERISKEKAIYLFESGTLDQLQPGTVQSLREIHRVLFEDIYDFAGQLRTVNLAKGNFRFAPVMYLRAALDSIEQMPQHSFAEIVEKYVEMNVAHPFREGNGRSTRIWLNVILKAEMGVIVDWSRIDKDDYLMAMERSPIKDTELKTLLHDALTTEVTSRAIYMKGIDRSYQYEGYSAFKAEALAVGHPPRAIQADEEFDI